MLEFEEPGYIVIFVVKSLPNDASSSIILTNCNLLVIEHHQITFRQIEMLNHFFINYKNLLSTSNIILLITFKLPLSVGRIWLFDDANPSHQYSLLVLLAKLFRPSMRIIRQRFEACLLVAIQPGAQRKAIIFTGIVLQYLNLKPFFIHGLPIFAPKFECLFAVKCSHEPILSKACQIQTNAAKNRGILPLLSKLAGDEGFEPPITGPEPVALPLGQSPLTLAIVAK
jgi:hypothetical protein